MDFAVPEVLRNELLEVQGAAERSDAECRAAIEVLQQEKAHAEGELEKTNKELAQLREESAAAGKAAAAGVEALALEIAVARASMGRSHSRNAGFDSGTGN